MSMLTEARFVSRRGSVEVETDCIVDTETGEIITIRPVDGIPDDLPQDVPALEFIRLEDGRECGINAQRSRIDLSGTAELAG